MSDGQIPSGTVTAADLYSAVEATRREVGQILTQVTVMDDRARTVAAQVADHESRIRGLEVAVPTRLADRVISLERWQWRAGGVVATCALLGGLLAGLLAALINHHP